MSRALARVLAPCLLAGLSLAQDDRARAVVSDAKLQMVPVHTLPDDPAFGAYGVWAAGPSYKVSFGESVAFYPLLGTTYPRNLPLAWRTESIRCGTTELLASGKAPRVERSEWRQELRHGDVTEAYDVRSDGLEQTFVLARCPGEGDLVVTGRVTTELHAAARGPEHAELTFLGPAGEALVTYGAAIAIDAGGQRTDVATSFDGDRIRLVVPGSWLATAAYPVTVDPLLARVVVTSSTVVTTQTAIGFDNGAPLANTMVVTARTFSATDEDTYAYLCNKDFSSPSLVFTDIVATLNTTNVGVCFNATAARWAISIERSATTVAQVRLWIMDRANTGLNTGGLMYLALTAGGTTDRRPGIGGYQPANGPATVPSVLVVYMSDVTSTNAETPTSVVRGVYANIATKTWGTPFALAPAAANLDRERPAVTQNSDGPAGSPNWLVVWQELDNTVATDDWEIDSALVNFTTGVSAPAIVTPPNTAPKHRMRPQVAGAGGHFMTTYVMTDTPSTAAGQQIAATRVEWPYGTPAPLLLATGVVGTDPIAPYELGRPKIAADTQTYSHWVVVYDAPDASASACHYARVSGAAQILEGGALMVGLTPVGFAPSVTTGFQDDWLFAYALNDASHTVYGQAHLPDAKSVLYGTGCGGTIVPSALPLAGSEQWVLSLQGAGASLPAALLIGPGPASTPLAIIGMPGCFLNLSSTPVTLGTSTSASGDASLGFGLPSFGLDVYLQWAFVKPGANATGVLTTPGLQAVIR